MVAACGNSHSSRMRSEGERESEASIQIIDPHDGICFAYQRPRGIGDVPVEVNRGSDEA